MRVSDGLDLYDAPLMRGCIGSGKALVARLTNSSKRKACTSMIKVWSLFGYYVTVQLFYL